MNLGILPIVVALVAALPNTAFEQAAAKKVKVAQAVFEEALELEKDCRERNEEKTCRVAWDKLIDASRRFSEIAKLEIGHSAPGDITLVARLSHPMSYVDKSTKHATVGAGGEGSLWGANATATKAGTLCLLLLPLNGSPSYARGECIDILEEILTDLDKIERDMMKKAGLDGISNTVNDLKVIVKRLKEEQRQEIPANPVPDQTPAPDPSPAPPRLKDPRGPGWAGLVSGTLLVTSAVFLGAAVQKSSKGGDLHLGIVNTAYKNGTYDPDAYDQCTAQATAGSSDLRTLCDSYQRWNNAVVGLGITTGVLAVVTVALVSSFAVRRKAKREQVDNKTSARVIPGVRINGTGVSLGLSGRF